MGLDMYLRKKTYVKNWDFMTPEQKHQVTVKKAGKKHKFIKSERISEITESIGYWRKANHIHKWFVDHVQNGVDDCGEYLVEHSQLQELLDTCILVRDNSTLVDGLVKNGATYTPGLELKWNLEPGKTIKDAFVAHELLPTQSGFFFGGTDYDQYYYQDVLDTIKILEEELNTKDEKGNQTGEVYYQSSW